MARAQSENGKGLGQNSEKYTHVVNVEEQEFIYATAKDHSEGGNHSWEKMSLIEVNETKDEIMIHSDR